MKKIIYSKFSNDRSYNYKIKTDIYENSFGKRFVVKSGLTNESKEHIRFMFDMSQKLEGQLVESKFEINKCSLEEDALALEYITGKGLDEILDMYIMQGQFDLFEKTVKLYAEEIRKLATRKFNVTTEYKTVFGDGAYDLEQCASMDISNIDMIFANIYVCEDKWTVLDYEWCFSFPVPVDFVLYRTLHYYLTPDREGVLKDIDLFDIFGLDRALEDTWYAMEQNFQSYVYDDNAPLWKLYDDMKQKSYFPQGIIKQQSIMHQMSVGLFKNQQTIIKNIDTVPEENGDVSLVFDIEPGVNTVILSLAACPCIVNVYRVTCENNIELEIKYGSNGNSYNNRLICFDTDTPQILIGDIPELVESIRIEFNIAYIHKTIGTEIKQLLELYNQEKCTGLERAVVIQEKDAVIQQKENTIHRLELCIQGVYNSLSWKITKPLRWIKGKIRRNNETK